MAEGQKRCRLSGSKVVGNVSKGDRLTCPDCGARTRVTNGMRVEPHPEAAKVPTSA
jgi:hypothetical protein